MIKFSVKHPVSITMLIGVFVALGVISLSKLGLDLFPELSFPAVTVVTRYSGVAPEDIENLITKPVEEAVSTISGVKKVTSSSMEGLSLVTVEFEWGKNLDFAAQDIRDKLGMIEGYLPEEASKPLVVKFDISMMPLMEYYAYSETLSPEEIKNILKEQVKPRLERLDGVASVTVIGGREREIWVEVTKEALNQYGISLSDIILALRAHNLNLPSGHLVKGHKEYLLRGIGEFEKIEDLKRVVVGMGKGGTPVYLRDIAEVKDTYKERRGYFRVNGKETSYFAVYKESGTNTVVVAERVKRELEKIKKTIPEIKFSLSFDQSKIIKRTINRTANNALWGGLLAILMILFFLRSFGPTLVISLAIPLSIVITFIVLYFAGYTLNVMTMGGIALGIGMLVDNAVVVLENIFRHLQQKEEKEKSAIDGTSEVGTAISASTFTTIAVFLPLVFIGGIVGRIAKQLALTVSSTLLASLFVAITIIPMLTRVFLKREKKKEYRGFLSKGWFEPVRNFYRRALGYALSHRLLVSLIAIIIFIVSLVLIPVVGVEFLPKMDRSFAIINITLPAGTNLEETNHYVKQIEEIARSYPDITDVSALVGEVGGEEGEAVMFGGETGVNTAMLFLSFVEREERRRPSSEDVEDIIDRAPSYKDAKVAPFNLSQVFTGGGEKPVKIDIYGKDLKTLRLIAERIKEKIKDIPGIVRPEISLVQAKPELHIRIDRAKASLYGLTPYQIENELEAALKGKVATRLRQKGEETDIRVVLKREERKSIEDLLAMVIKSPPGLMVPLKDIAKIEYRLGPIKIDREKQTRVVSVLADNRGRSIGKIMGDVEKRLSKIKLPSGYLMGMGGEFENIKEMLKDVIFAVLASILLIYMIMAAQFESFKDPFIVLFTLPLTVIGVVLLLLLTKTTISVTSSIGLLILVGIVVNNAIVMITYIKQLRQRGLEPYNAVIEGAVIRLRPILITALTTIIGMLPMALSRSAGSELRAPMAIAVIGGLSTSTFLTLFIIPVVYTIFERIRPVKSKK